VILDVPLSRTRAFALVRQHERGLLPILTATDVNLRLGVDLSARSWLEQWSDTPALDLFG